MILAYAIVLRLAPQEQWLALTTAVFVAFLPQHMAIITSANNDALAELLLAAILYMLLLVAQRPHKLPFQGSDSAPSKGIRSRDYILLGTLLGLGYLTKGTVYSITAIVGLLLLWRFWGQWRLLIRAGLRVFLPAIVLGAIWWGRNIVVYGGLDILGKTAHDSVVVGQPRTAEWVVQYGWPGTIE